MAEPTRTEETLRRAWRDLPWRRRSAGREPAGRPAPGFPRRVPWRRLRPSSRVGTGLLIVLVAMAGAVLGLLLGSRTGVDIGPFNAELRLTPSATGDTAVLIPPLGSLRLDTHEGPAQLTIQLGALDQARTQAMINDPGGVTRAARTVADDVVDGVVRVGLGSLGAAVLGAMLLAALVFRDVRRVAWAGGLALLMMGASLGTAAATFRVNAVEEPRYDGLLVNAPALVGDVRQIADDYERYTEQLQSLVSNASTLYTAASTLDVLTPDDTVTRVLHVSDLHLNPAAWEIMRTVVEQYSVDFIIDTGDITDWGTGPEAGAYVTAIRAMRVPYVYVRGNHDSVSVTQAAVEEEPNAIVLDDSVETVAGLTIAGIGDPRFTPDQRTDPHTEEQLAAARQLVVDSGADLAATIRASEEPVDVAAVHDPVAAAPLDGLVPLVLAGHTHNRQVGPVERSPDAPGAAEPDEGVPLRPDQTRLMVQGSTGGAGLRGLQDEHPESLALSVLYFNEFQQLIAYDDITVGGHGLSEASVQRNLVEPPPEPPLSGP